MSLYYTVIIRKKVHFSFTVEITSCRLIFCILKSTTRLGGSSGSHNYSTACYALVQKDQRKKSFSGPGVSKAHATHHQKLPNTLKPPAMNLRAAIQKIKTYQL